MKRPALVGLGLAGLALLLIALLAVRALAPRAGARVAIRGGDAGGLPLESPHDQHMDPELLELAARDPVADGLEVMLVMRRDHLVFQRFGHGYSANSEIDSGPFAAALLGLVAGVAAQRGALAEQSVLNFDPNRLRDAIENGTHQPYANYLGNQLWSPLNGADAWISLPSKGAPVPADCCFHARALDWMRIAGVLVNGGQFQGTRVVPASWVQRMRMPLGFHGTDGFGIELAGAARGHEPFRITDAFFLRGPAHWRLWLVPSYQLSVLFGAEAHRPSDVWDETHLPNLVIGAIQDAPTPQNAGSRLQQLVPGH